jgi:hypothetical protein
MPIYAKKLAILVAISKDRWPALLSGFLLDGAIESSILRQDAH